MKKILLPLEDTERSLKSLNYVRKHYTPDDAELVLIMVDERLGYSARSDAEIQAIREIEENLAVIAGTLEEYKTSAIAAVGKAGLRITRAAREAGADLIIMTKSSKADMLNAVGSTTEYVINNSPCDVVIVSELTGKRNEYRGLIYRTAAATVNLRGQLGDKHSECLLPSVNQDCIYRIEVTVGKIRFFHTSYNPDTKNWDLLPKPGQEVTLDITAGETRNLLVKADSNDGKADRIRIVNRDMKKEAVFRFRIFAAQKDADGNPIDPEKEAVRVAMANRATMEIPRIKDEPGKEFKEPEVPTFMTEARKEAEKPVQEAEEPVQEAEEPVQEAEEPVQEAEEPVQEVEEPVQTAKGPLKDVTEAIEAATEAAGNTAEAIEAEAEPVEDTAETIEAEAEPVEDTAEAIGAAAEPLENNEEPAPEPIFEEKTEAAPPVEEKTESKASRFSRLFKEIVEKKDSESAE